MSFMSNPHRFTADEAFAAQEDGDPLMLTEEAALAIFRTHDTAETWETYLADMTAEGREHLDSANLLGWLGY